MVKALKLLDRISNIFGFGKNKPLELDYHKLLKDMGNANIKEVTIATKNSNFDIAATTKDGNNLLHCLAMSLKFVNTPEAADNLLVTSQALLCCDISKKIVSQLNNQGESFSSLLASYIDNPTITANDLYWDLLEGLNDIEPWALDPSLYKPNRAFEESFKLYCTEIFQGIEPAFGINLGGNSVATIEI